MKASSLITGILLAAFGVGVLASLPAGAAGEDQKKKTAEVQSLDETNFPSSFFDLKATQVKDPFFPLSTRSAIPVMVVTNAQPSSITFKSFIFNGMSRSETVEGTLVTINGHAFAPGEKYDILPIGATAKVGVTVKQIKDFSVIIQVDGHPEPIELSLPEDAH